MKKIKIGFIINSIKKNGPGKVLLNIINNLSKTKYDISLITLFQENDAAVVNELRDSKIKVIEMENNKSIRFLFTGHKIVGKMLAKHDFDVIHTHGLIPDVLISKIKVKFKKINTIHCDFDTDYYNTYGFLKGKIFTYLHYKALKKYDLCVSCSQTIKSIVDKKIDNSGCIVNGVDIEFEKNEDISRKKLNIPENAIVYVYAGHLSVGKNVEFLVKKFSKHHKKNEYLIILGDGDLLNECTKYKSKNIRIEGFTKNVMQYFSLSDVYVSASLSEGFSISVIEALSQGLALFLSSIPSHNEALNINEKKYIGENFTEDNFEAKLNIFRKNYSLINKKNITKLYENELSGKIMTKKYDKLYNEIIGDTRG